MRNIYIINVMAIPITMTISDEVCVSAPSSSKRIVSTCRFMSESSMICLILGILFTIIGNYMPKMNYETGKKLFHPTPKTEKSFRKMSRIMGHGFLGIGIILLILIIWV